MLGSMQNDIIIGRNNDVSLKEQLKLHNDNDDKVKLSYQDKQGNSLTLKQSFREMSWKFHGMKPSHRK